MTMFNAAQNSLYHILETICVIENIHDYNGIQETARKYNIATKCSEEELETVIKVYLSSHKVHIDSGAMLIEENHQEWYQENKKNNPMKFWNRYWKYLLHKKNFSNTVLNRMDKTTDEIMDLVGDPNSLETFSRKGMIIGDVQSGKTATYIGLMNKAADAGYRVVILLTGLIEKLRSQTQERVDYGFIGLDSNRLDSPEARTWVGVGEFDPSISAIGLTSKSQDFNFHIAQLRGKLDCFNTAVVFVLKKNKTILEWLEKWMLKNIDSSGKVPYPMLLLDDEADNGSINTNKQGQDATTINACIRRIFNLFTKATYIGCTATPYANIFIDPDPELQDLFPTHFIYSLPSPSNYMGAASIFSDSNDRYAINSEETDIKAKAGKFNFVLKDINDCEKYIPISHKSKFEVENLPKSMEKAIISFFIANTIRDLRGDVSSHRTMLVNVSRFIKVQNDLTYKIDSFVRDYRRDIDCYAALSEKEALSHKCIKNIHDVYAAEYRQLPDDGSDSEKHYSWQQIQHALRDSVATIQVRSVNGGNAVKNLNYDENKVNGLRLIAVGGLSLSRGLTLEGLIISYYYRNTKMYDTMLQMGRWFGYRDGYADLCQVWMSEESQDWYTYITKATEELKRDIRIMQGQNKTPEEFGMRVRSDKNALLVTAKNKMQTSTMTDVLVSLSQTVVETKYVKISKDSICKNFELVRKWISENLKPEYLFNSEDRALRSSLQFKNLNYSKIVELLRDFDASDLNTTFQTETLAEMIDKSASITPYWDVLIASGKYGDVISFGQFSVPRVQRSYSIKKGPIAQIAGDSAHLGSRNAYKCGLTTEEVSEIIQIVNDQRCKEDKGKDLRQEDYFVKTNNQRNPLLVIWPLELTGAGKTHSRYVDNLTIRNQIDDMNHSDENIAVIGLSIGYPKVDERTEVKARYKVNKIYAQNMFGITDDEDCFEEMGDEAI